MDFGGFGGISLIKTIKPHQDSSNFIFLIVLVVHYDY